MKCPTCDSALVLEERGMVCTAPIEENGKVDLERYTIGLPTEEQAVCLGCGETWPCDGQEDKAGTYFVTLTGSRYELAGTS